MVNLWIRVAEKKISTKSFLKETWRVRSTKNGKKTFVSPETKRQYKWSNPNIAMNNDPNHQFLNSYLKSSNYCVAEVSSSDSGSVAPLAMPMFWNLPTSGSQWGQANQIINFQRLFIVRIIFSNIRHNVNLTSHYWEIGTFCLIDMNVENIQCQYLKKNTNTRLSTVQYAKKNYFWQKSSRWNGTEQSLRDLSLSWSWYINILLRDDEIDFLLIESFIWGMVKYILTSNQFMFRAGG